MIEKHIFWFGLMKGYDVWIYHGENANATISSSLLEKGAGIPERDVMFDVFDDIISDDA